MQNVIILSGGMDSYTLLHSLLNRQPPASIYAITFDYNQRHRREIEAAKVITSKLDVAHYIIPLPFLAELSQKSSLTNQSRLMPHGHYADETMKQTVVPGRNTLMLAAALAFAEGRFNEAEIYYGAHAGDHTIYPDCRPEFVAAMQETIARASAGTVTLCAPFLYISKTDILVEGLQLRALGRPVDYGDTWTCYEGGDVPCGLCGACVERSEAFASLHEVDPLVG